MATVDDVTQLWLLRHGQSQGNVIRDSTQAEAEALDIPDRDMDVPLSSLGRRQAEAFGEWLGQVAPERRPQTVISSPYRRAIETARLVASAARLDLPIQSDERLRERDLGLMDMLTLRGFTARYPDEAAHRTRLGKFYYRPPGGESWVDVALRCRSVRDSIAREHAGRQVLLVTHEVAIIVFRYLLESLDENDALGLSQDAAISNCSLTAYSRNDRGELAPDLVDWTVPLEERQIPASESPDEPVGSR